MSKKKRDKEVRTDDASLAEMARLNSTDEVTIEYRKPNLDPRWLTKKFWAREIEMEKEAEALEAAAKAGYDRAVGNALDDPDDDEDDPDFDDDDFDDEDEVN